MMDEKRMVELAKVIACTLWEAVSQDTRDSFVDAARAACLFFEGEN